jgi:hypothetical protein
VRGRAFLREYDNICRARQAAARNAIEKSRKIKWLHVDLLPDDIPSGNHVNPHHLTTTCEGG